MLIIDPKEPVVTIAIDRSESLNTLTHELILKLTETIADWGARKDIRVIILTGNGDKSFIGGVDVRAMMDLDSEGAEKFITDLHRCCLAIRQAESIVIASLNGFALGGGLEIAAACDLRIASDKARFGMPEVRVGIPSVIESAILPSLIGVGRTAELVYTGAMIDAAEAERIGLIHKLVPKEALKEATWHWVDQILQNGPTAMILQKKLIAQWMELSLTDSIAAGIGSFRKCFQTREPHEGMKAFLEKRPADYQKNN
jgi:enoyl-CoA hydratase/carnithine racemase